jgi:acyl-phosphate glycerol 3-phosphate acyltransferase
MEWYKVILIFIVAFIGGSIPFSPLIIHLMGKDYRKVYIGNPGAGTVLLAGSIPLFLLVMLLDISKGLLPVLLYRSVATYWQFPIIALAPVLGHAFSPFLSFKGGKAIAPTCGIWMLLGFWQAPILILIGGFLPNFMFKQPKDIVRTAFIFAAVAASLLMIGVELNLWVLLLANFAVVMFKQAQYLPAETRFYLR